MAKKLDTIQTKEVLNEVYSVDDIGPGGANHEYWVEKDNGDGTHDRLAEIVFQKGARKEPTSQNGVIDSDLLEIVRDRLKAFQAGPFASNYNEVALYHVEAALEALNDRVEDRIKRNVLGEEKK